MWLSCELNDRRGTRGGTLEGVRVSVSNKPKAPVAREAYHAIAVQRAWLED